MDLNRDGVSSRDEFQTSHSIDEKLVMEDRVKRRLGSMKKDFGPLRI